MTVVIRTSLVHFKTQSKGSGGVRWRDTGVRASTTGGSGRLEGDAGTAIGSGRVDYGVIDAGKTGSSRQVPRTCSQVILS